MSADNYKISILDLKAFLKVIQANLFFIVALSLLGFAIGYFFVTPNQGKLKVSSFVKFDRIKHQTFINEFDIDAIVTDPPYGLSTTTKGEGVKDLMKRSMLLFSQKLEKKQRLIMAISNPKLVRNSDFNILYQFEWYIHKSLTRYIVVMEKN